MVILQPWELGWSVYGDSFEEIKSHPKDNKYNFPSRPHTVLLAPGGKALFRPTGQVDPIELRGAIVQELCSRE